MSWYRAKSLTTLIKQINELFPNRDKASDGTVGDLAHSRRKSDHNPNGQGVVCAVDIDKDLSPGGGAADVGLIVSALQKAKDPRVKYIIWNGMITQKGNVAAWKPYRGANAHKAHAHISVHQNSALYDDGRAWDLSGISGADAPPPEPTPTANGLRPELRFGATGEAVKRLQQLLIKETFLPPKSDDGHFGRQTMQAVVAFQRMLKLDADGIVGPKTWAELEN
jgi:murein L,D-transpeptidase YcbB/YkuD